jgi:hypothetical protein
MGEHGISGSREERHTGQYKIFLMRHWSFRLRSTLLIKILSHIWVSE